VTTRKASTSRIARLIRKALKEGHHIEIEGFGTFLPSSEDAFVFVQETRPRIFIAYVRSDLRKVRRLYADLKKHGYQPWLDKENLLPGQNWPLSIERAIDVSDFFIACFSKQSVPKRGVFQSELRYALDCAARMPLDEIFFIPVRLDECDPPERVVRHLHHVDLFGNWAAGMAQLRRTIDTECARKLRQKLPLAS
jgi:hypothetical protein